MFFANLRVSVYNVDQSDNQIWSMVCLFHNVLVWYKSSVVQMLQWRKINTFTLLHQHRRRNLEHHFRERRWEWHEFYLISKNLPSLNLTMDWINSYSWSYIFQSIFRMQLSMFFRQMISWKNIVKHHWSRNGRMIRLISTLRAVVFLYTQSPVGNALRPLLWNQ